MKTIIVSGKITNLHSTDEGFDFMVKNNEEPDGIEMYRVYTKGKLAKACEDNLTENSKVIVLGNFYLVPGASGVIAIRANRIEFVDIHERA